MISVKTVPSLQHGQFLHCATVSVQVFYGVFTLPSYRVNRIALFLCYSAFLDDRFGCVENLYAIPRPALGFVFLQSGQARRVGVKGNNPEPS